jgi:hypothetical protein
LGQGRGWRMRKLKITMNLWSFKNYNFWREQEREGKE